MIISLAVTTLLILILVTFIVELLTGVRISHPIVH